MSRTEIKTLHSTLESGILYLQRAGIGEARREAWLLLEHVCGMDHSAYYLHQDDPIKEEQAAAYEALLAGRARRVPVQYLTGEAWFYGLRFEVDPRVLIPRPDTELLVETAAAHLRPGMRLLDLCTGSGCVLLALLSLCPEAEGTGSDLSAGALAVAEKNSRALGIPAAFVQSDLFAQIRGTYDVIVSNPPYIERGVIPTLMPEVREYEPRAALDGGEDGRSFYRRILREASGFLRPSGWLCLEIGCDQGPYVRELLENAGYEEAAVYQDLSGLDRVAAGRLADGGSGSKGEEQHV